MAAMIEAGVDPAVVARMALDAIRNNRLYVFTDMDLRERIRTRGQQIDLSFEDTLAFLKACSQGL